jgi:hypothetical protein
MLSYSPFMLFLVKYRRSTGTLLSFEQFSNTDDQLAALNASDIFDSDGNLVLDHDIEIVALASQSVETLKVTHGNYFKRTPEDLQPTVR